MRVWWPGIAVLLSVGCGPPRTPYPAALLSERPEERVAAIKHAARVGDQSAVPLLVDRLEDDDEAVRFYAILALEKLTGTRRGYDYGGPETQRWRAVEQWRRYLRERTGAGPPAGSRPS
ncbi:MAG: HEAT repeat domain-containing protein [Phycisphaerae bacterium]